MSSTPSESDNMWTMFPGFALFLSLRGQLNIVPYRADKRNRIRGLFMDKVKDDIGNSNWPLNPYKDVPTKAVLDEVIKSLPSYVHGALYCKPKEVGMADSPYEVFCAYCYIVKENLAKLHSNEEKLREIVGEAFGLIDRLLEYVYKRRYPPHDMRFIPADYPYSLNDLSNQWDTIVRKFTMYQDSMQDREESKVALTDSEQNLLEALGGKTLRGPELLREAGYDNSSHYRTILSNLVKRNILRKKQNGYCR